VNRCDQVQGKASQAGLPLWQPRVYSFRGPADRADSVKMSMLWSGAVAAIPAGPGGSSVVMRGFNSKNGLAFQQTNKTGYDESRYMHLVCPICLTPYHRPPSHIARCKGVSTCSVACAVIARRVRVETHCVTCGKSMEQTPSNAVRVVTCSKECSTVRRIKDIATVKPYGLGVYIAKVKEIKSFSQCKNCGVEVGPWVVRGLGAAVSPSGEVELDESDAELWCRHCHLEKESPAASTAAAVVHSKRGK